MGEIPGELRCFCRARPLLATFGIDSEGQLYIHVKVHKQGKVYGEIVARGGDVRLRCRVCYRWHRVFIRQGSTPVLNLDRTVSESFPNG